MKSLSNIFENSFSELKLGTFEVNVLEFVEETFKEWLKKPMDLCTFARSIK